MKTVSRLTKLAILSVAAVGLFASTGQAYVLWGTSWGAGANVTYSFDYAGGYTINESGIGGPNTTSTSLDTVLAAGYESEIVAAFNTWTAMVDITFSEVADNTLSWDVAGAEGDIRIAAHDFDGAGGTLAHAYYPPPNGITAAGDLHFDLDESWYVGPGAPGGGEFDLYSVALHEIGHSIGIGHSADTDAVMYPFYWYNGPRALDADDVAAGQAIYGAGSGATPEPETLLVIGVFLAAAVFVRNGSLRGRASAGST